MMFVKEPEDYALEKGIKCKCGKYWGMKYLNTKCFRCQTEVIARGN